MSRGENLNGISISNNTGNKLSAIFDACPCATINMLERPYSVTVNTEVGMTMAALAAMNFPACQLAGRDISNRSGH